MNKNFCVAPWVHLHVINDGRAFPCCQTPLEDNNSFGNVKNSSIYDIINSSAAKDMRRNMLSNKPLPKSCERCISKETHGFQSMRTGLNKKWIPETTNLIADTKTDGTIENFQIKYWDYRFSNFCNLACPTCGPLFSTQWHNDWKKLYPEKKVYEKSLIDLKDANMFWQEFEQYAKDVKEVHIAGGEPFMMPENIKFLDTLEKDNNYDISIRYSTNCTMLEHKGKNILDRLKKFKYVHLSCSIDGIEETFEYVRYKGNWKKVFNNLKQIRSSGLDYWIHPTVSILNIFRITELHELLDREDIIPLEKVHKDRSFNIDNYWIDRMHFNPLFVPNYYSITTLPKKLKNLAEEKITIYGKKVEKEKGIPFNGWQNIIDFMYQYDNSNFYELFLTNIKKLDNIRNTDFFKINKEFNSVL